MYNVSGDIQLPRGCVLSRRQKRGTRGQREKFGENKYASVKEKVVEGGVGQKVMSKAEVLASCGESDPGRGQGWVALMVMHLSGVSRIPATPSRMNRSPITQMEQGTYPWDSISPEGWGVPGRRHRGWGQALWRSCAGAQAR